MINSVFLPLDNQGNILHAHGGHMLKQGQWYYWIGEDRTENNKVSCYKSKDLTNWIFCNHLLTTKSQTASHNTAADLTLEMEGRQADIGKGCNIERPKVLYNPKTGKYVMWMHWELPDDYQEARCAVAVCDTVDGDYTYLGSFRPLGHMSRDCTVFQEEDGSAYFISASRNNLDLHIYKLTDDYLSIDQLVCVLWPGQEREAPVLFKRREYYYMLTSGCTGWAPNQSAYAYSKTIDGPWSELYLLGDETTYGSQPTSILCLKNEKTEDSEYWYLGDRWKGSGQNYYQSEYVLLPLHFKSDTELYLEWRPNAELKIDWIQTD